MKVIGLLGGIGSGKSTIAQQLMELGAHKIDADKVGHEILSDEDVRHAVKNRWGEFVFDENGWIDRARLAKMVFGITEGESSSLADLEAITHPRDTTSTASASRCSCRSCHFGCPSADQSGLGSPL